MAFDDRGRIWITQSIEYPRKSGGPGRDRVMLIDGVDDAGRATAVSTFVDDLNIPTGIAFGYGGVWVLNSPDLLFFREKDGKEISREVVLTGFGRTDSHELPSSLTWGPDGWLYGLNGVFNQSHVTAKDGKRHDFTCAMWRVRPRPLTPAFVGLRRGKPALSPSDGARGKPRPVLRVSRDNLEFEIVCEGTSNPYGIAWDGEGS